MPKVTTFSESQNDSFLDKLAQLSPLPYKPDIKPVPGADLGKLKKRAKARWFTQTYLQHLINLDSPLKKSYTNTVFCCHTLYQKDDKITSRYCNNRWCIVCNRIRIGKAINGYLPQMKEFTEPYFLTLTIPNVKGSDLRATIGGMTKVWRLLYKSLKKRSITLTGIRKTECTYNPEEDTYHPHFHLIVDGRQLGDEIIAGWMARYPTANLKAQDMRVADEGSMIELFKYFTKLISKEKLYIPALDVIFQAMAGLRVFQPFGIQKVSEEVEELKAEVIDGIDPGETFWEWLDWDWIESTTNKPLTGHVPTQKMLEIAENVIF